MAAVVEDEQPPLPRRHTQLQHREHRLPALLHLISGSTATFVSDMRQRLPENYKVQRQGPLEPLKEKSRAAKCRSPTIGRSGKSSERKASATKSRSGDER